MNELSTTPNKTNGEQSFTITHPFHPLCGQTFPLLAQHVAWGEERVFFPDPQTHEVRSLPLAWTSLALPDPFLVVASGQGVRQEFLHAAELKKQCHATIEALARRQNERRHRWTNKSGRQRVSRF